MCGEKKRRNENTICDVGSPPHVRGKGHRTRQAVYKDRITPACAGKRENTFTPAKLKQDHPRMCGEKELHGLKRDSY